MIELWVSMEGCERSQLVRLNGENFDSETAKSAARIAFGHTQDAMVYDEKSNRYYDCNKGKFFKKSSDF